MPNDEQCFSKEVKPYQGLSKTFYLFWISQTISLFGSSLSGFALSVWLYQRTGSVLDFSTSVLCSTLPMVLVTPLAGSIIDRYSKRWVMVISDSFTGLSVLSIGILVWLNVFEVWHLYLVDMLIGIAGAFGRPAVKSSMSLLVSKDQLGRATGLFEITSSLLSLIAPLLAGMLLSVVGLEGVIFIDVVSCIIAVIFLTNIKIPFNKIDGVNQVQHGILLNEVFANIFNDFKQAVMFYIQRPSMLHLAFQLMIAAFVTSMAGMLYTPLVLGMHSEHELAMIVSVGSIGGIIGGLLMAIHGGPKRWSSLLLFLNIGEGLTLIVFGMAHSLVLLMVCAFYIFFSTGLFGACVNAIWQRKIPQEKQGSVFALEHLVMGLLAPISAFLGGGLVHYVFEPMLLANGMLADSLGLLIGVGKGRGVGLLFMLSGMLLVIVTIFSLLNRHVRQLETHVPDAF